MMLPQWQWSVCPPLWFSLKYLKNYFMPLNCTDSNGPQRMNPDDFTSSTTISFKCVVQIKMFGQLLDALSWNFVQIQIQRTLFILEGYFSSTTHPVHTHKRKTQQAATCQRPQMDTRNTSKHTLAPLGRPVYASLHEAYMRNQTKRKEFTWV